MAIVPAGYPIGLQDAGADPTVTAAPILKDFTLTVGSTSFNTLQAWTDLAYTYSYPAWTINYTRYIKNLTGGWLHGYAPSMQYSGMSGSSNGVGGTYGPTARATLVDSGAPGSASGADFGPSSTNPGTPWSSNRSAIMASITSTYGAMPLDGSTGIAGQFAESLSQTNSYQGRTKYGQDFTCNASGSIGSASASDLEFTSKNGDEWKIMQIIAGQNTYTTGNFPNANGPYNGSNETSSNTGNFVYIAFFRQSGHLTLSQMQSVTADDLFSHIQLNGQTAVLASGLSGYSVQSGLSPIVATSSNRMYGSYTTNVVQSIGFLWPGLSDTQVQNLINYGGSSSINVKVYAPVSSTTYKNGIAEEHGGADSNNVKLSEYIKGAEYVSAGNSSSTIPSTLLDVSFSDYQNTSDDGGAAGGSLFVDSANNGDYYPYYGAGVYGATVEYVYLTGLVASPAYGAFVPSTAAARTYAIDGTNQVLTEASIAYATPNGTNFIARFTPASGNTNDIMGTSDWNTITLTKTNNTSHSNTLTLTSSSSGYSYSTFTTSQATGQIIPTATISFLTNSPSTTNNYIYNWITDNGTKTGIQDFNFIIS